ncbi:nucleoside-diphosphate sugar epimerase, partial [Achromatium sp. WMS3]
VGGPGLVRGRRHATDVRIGDRIDSWEVVGITPESNLTLAFGMRAPGAGVMEFALEPITDNKTKITVHAYWHPAGVWGLLYWTAMIPLHSLIFNALPKKIAQRAEKLASKASVN